MHAVHTSPSYTCISVQPADKAVGQRDRQTDRQTETDRDRDRETERRRDRERETDRDRQ